MTGAPAVTPRGLGGMATLLLVAALAAGCSSGDSTDSDTQPTFPDESFTVIANADIGTGSTRLLIGVVAEDGTRLGSPDRPIRVEAALLDDPDRSQQVPADYTWIIEDAVGLYRAEFDFDQGRDLGYHRHARARRSAATGAVHRPRGDLRAQRR